MSVFLVFLLKQSFKPQWSNHSFSGVRVHTQEQKCWLKITDVAEELVARNP